MEIIRHDAPETIELLSDFFKRGTLVPVFGAGFTVGESAQSGAKVPSGTQLSELMLEQLKQHGIGLSEDDLKKLEGYRFPDLCEVYFDQSILPQEITKATIRERFYNVSLSSNKASLINDIDWKYIYTLNIDNAIERHSQYSPIYPYDSNLSNSSRNFRPVYKLHGDVYYEVTHDSERLVFQKASYLESIETNKRMLEILEEDLLYKNILFIGCSLTDEDDIAFLVSGQKSPKDSKTKRIIFRSAAPSSLESSVLRRHGINTVILIDDRQYDQTYSLIQKAYSLSAEGDAELEKYIFETTVLDANARSNQDFLIKGVAETVGQSSKSAAILPYYYGVRSKEKQIISSIHHGGSLVLLGPRVSGRTLTLRSIANSFKDRKVFFIDSGTELETHFVNRLLGLSNSLIIFDSKTIDTELAKVIRNNETKLRERKTSVLITLDSGEGYIIDALSPSKLSQVPIIEISRVFDQSETKLANQGLKSVRCPTFKGGKKLLDNLFFVYETLGQNTVIKRVPKEKELLNLLYLMSVKRKVNGDWARFISSDLEHLEKIVSSCSPYLEFEKLDITEIANHSGYKIICNSEAWLLAVMSELYRSRGEAWCVDAIFNLVRDLPDDEKRLSIDLSLFDSLNFAFGGDLGGAGDLILKFYERLEVLRGSEPEFFVQKAKAYYSMYRALDVVDELSKRLQELAIAETWASSENNSAAERNIRHTSALISLRRAAECKFENLDYTIDAIKRTWTAISGEQFNSEYVAKLADGSLKGSEYLKGLLKAVSDGRVTSPRLLEVKDYIDSIKMRSESEGKQ
ncbi:SIR2 family protein [Pseudomonas lutea]|uniref:SIR2-like domain-containing protein n=1 Tax=Pseudomonas lutea TaxID=243924 RepID=A0A9X0EA64_9PSED|nr:SIR2 family protein [Pseudomonas lutea]KGF62067.1 hypothetical protein LT42_25205 [Pseudomonas lutea]